MELSTNRKVAKTSIDNSGAIDVSWIVYFFCGIVVSCYFFPFGFTFLPKGLNTKIMLGILAIPILGYTCIVRKEITVDKEFIPAIFLALIFSIIGYISVDINNSEDTSYANYLISFATWMTAAYACCKILKYCHGYLNCKLLFTYITVISVVQCFLALLIDNNQTVKDFVDTYISQETIADIEFLNVVDRLYGIGAALDVAGTRFSIVLLGLATIISSLTNQQNARYQLIFYWLCFVILTVIGNMISRTTTVGAALAIFYLFAYRTNLNFKFSINQIKNLGVIFWTSILLIAIAVYFYNTDDNIRAQIRYGFEGFFNWVEKGEWKTDSTDKLNSEMWIWPEANDYKTWLIGKATFDNWSNVGTDIGYCRFVFYNGLIGLITFSLFFVYNAYAMIQKFPMYKLFFAILLSLSFIIWWKVATDLFIIYALFYCLDKEEEVIV